MSSNNRTIIWSDPPKRIAGRIPGGLKFAWLVDALRERPGSWAFVSRGKPRAALNTQAQTLREGKYYREYAHPGRLESAVRRTVDGDDYGLWVRWVPPGGDS